jgi:hypothetical protein
MGEVLVTVDADRDPGQETSGLKLADCKVCIPSAFAQDPCMWGLESLAVGIAAFLYEAQMIDTVSSCLTEISTTYTRMSQPDG